MHRAHRPAGAAVRRAHWLSAPACTVKARAHHALPLGVALTCQTRRSRAAARQAPQPGWSAAPGGPAGGACTWRGCVVHASFCGGRRVRARAGTVMTHHGPARQNRPVPRRASCCAQGQRALAAHSLVDDLGASALAVGPLVLRRLLGVVKAHIERHHLELGHIGQAGAARRRQGGRAGPRGVRAAAGGDAAPCAREWRCWAHQMPSQIQGAAERLLARTQGVQGFGRGTLRSAVGAAMRNTRQGAGLATLAWVLRWHAPPACCVLAPCRTASSCPPAASASVPPFQFYNLLSRSNPKMLAFGCARAVSTHRHSPRLLARQRRKCEWINGNRKR